jgi:hypothetical protein
LSYRNVPFQNSTRVSGVDLEVSDFWFSSETFQATQISVVITETSEDSKEQKPENFTKFGRKIMTLIRRNFKIFLSFVAQSLVLQTYVYVHPIDRSSIKPTEPETT